MKNNHIEIITELHMDNPLKIQIVLGELSQSLINIINNSKDALKNKDLDRKWIKVSCIEKENRAIITIEDNAGGIPEDIIAKVFDPYFTTKHKSQGTGIGLYMTKNIIESHLSGRLYVQNTENGAKFFIELPLNN